MTKQKRIQVRPVQNPGMVRKIFRRVFQTAIRINPKLVHPLSVIADLRVGSLASLDLYLKQNKGIADREVALELRKLISGSRYRSKFRLIVIEHPDRPKSKGGRPLKKMQRPSEEKFKIAREFRAAKRPGEVESAAQQVADLYEITTGKVYRFSRDVADYQATQVVAEAVQLEQEERTLELQLRREKILKAARKSKLGLDK
ncbi:hypothetical protein [Parasphingorhabdus sp.]|uniref:hypothetical protein n=1 Tax=Parasphingorhabdus sp. TaxID=2709688 RepID=UPI003001FC81